MCGYTLGSQSVAYCFWVTVTLTSDPRHSKTVCRAYIVYCFQEGIPKCRVWIHVGVPECPVLFWGYFDLDLWHISYIIGGRIPNLVCGYNLGLQSVTHCFCFFDHCGLDLWYHLWKSIVFGGFFVTLWHNSCFCLIINAQPVSLKVVQPFFSPWRKDWIV